MSLSNDSSSPHVSVIKDLKVHGTKSLCRFGYTGLQHIKKAYFASEFRYARVYGFRDEVKHGLDVWM